uniref:Uncharacterized protein n=1 Tax=Anguilla anguilla TaxID=7936 RepID=A0A0E9S9S8_ANGAN
MQNSKQSLQKQESLTGQWSEWQTNLGTMEILHVPKLRTCFPRQQRMEAFYCGTVNPSKEPMPSACCIRTVCTLTESCQMKRRNSLYRHLWVCPSASSQ